MFSKKSFFTFLAMTFVLAGCATTGRNYEADINALNSKLAALQGQISSKDEEIARLQSQVKDEESARAQAEAERRALLEKLESTAAELNSKAQKAKVDSDLK